MGLLDDLLPRRKEDDMMEVPEDVDATSKKSVTVRIETLTDFVDVDRVARLAKDGNIVFLRARDLQRKDLGEFQNCVAKLKKVSNQYGFDLVGTEDGYLLVTPPFAKIQR
jgi:SepF-like predicted cell division protein (DUF552 family)